MRVKIHGAGSIGNHLAQACCRAGHSVTVVDVNERALDRMKGEIYPARYGAWNEGIQLYKTGSEPKGGFDIIMLGTPPDVRLGLATAALEEKPKAVLLEKPLCSPGEVSSLVLFAAEVEKCKVLAFVGYDHAVAASTTHVCTLLKQGVIGEVLTIEVAFLEYWGGIFKAHPWLSGPHESYLGFTARGGGASGEHSHALHLFLTFASAAGWRDVKKSDGCLRMVTDKKGCRYDDIARFTIHTTDGNVGHVVQDVVTMPTRKHATIQGSKGSVEWVCNAVPDGDMVIVTTPEGVVTEDVFLKKRPDDFYAEVMHIEAVLSGEILYQDSPIRLSTGRVVMDILRGAKEC